MAAERAEGSHGQSWKVPLELSSDYGPSRFEFLIHAEADYGINWKSFTKSSPHRSELIFSVCVCGGAQKEDVHFKTGVSEVGQSQGQADLVLKA